MTKKLNSQTRILLPVALAAMTLLTTIPALGQSATQVAPQEWAKGRLIVMQRAGLPAAELDKALKPHGGKARRLGRSDLHVVDLPAGMPETVVLMLLQRHPALKFAELDYKVPRALVANDPYAGSQWHLPITGTPQAWDRVTGAGVTIAVLDGGVLSSHVDLAANLLPGYNAWDGGSETSDINNHGTAVAGTAAGVLNNGVGVSGVAGGAKIKPIRITDFNGSAWTSTIANGVIYAADNGYRVANCSYGWLFKTASIQSAGNYLKSKGGLLVVSAGNNGADEIAPATSSMITVSATDSADRLASWSSFGAMVSISAPGVGIWTTASNGGYDSVNGTSFAAPLVAGVVALMMSANPSLSASQIESLLFATATDLGAAGRDIYFGRCVAYDAAGNSQVSAAVAVNVGNNVVQDTVAPQLTVNNPQDGSTVSATVQISASASDNLGAAGIKQSLVINGVLRQSSIGSSLSYNWNTRKERVGSHSILLIATDAAGNQVSQTVTVNKIK